MIPRARRPARRAAPYLIHHPDRITRWPKPGSALLSLVEYPGKGLVPKREGLQGVAPIFSSRKTTGRSGDEQILAWNTFFAGPRLARLLRRDVYGARFDPCSVMHEQADLLAGARRAGQDRLGQILHHNLQTYLLDDLLVKADRMTMVVGLEARSPFLDTALVELAFRLPSAFELRRGSLEWLLQEAYRGDRGVLGPEVLDRQKHGFGVPLGAWWSGEGPRPGSIWVGFGQTPLRAHTRA